jgi:REP element-mobilizing transposase RayT
MPFDSNIHHRRSIRLRGYDYSQAGAYFVTICAHLHKCRFADKRNGTLYLNDEGRMVAEQWTGLVANQAGIELDEWVVMPNHFHGIVILENTQPKSPDATISHRNMSLSKLVGRFKMQSAKQINLLQKTPGQPVWQRNYWEHVVRNETDLQRIRDYIRNNPATWATDKLHR